MASDVKNLNNGLSGHELKNLFDSGYNTLLANIDTINSLNVFPVPDGDTGTNMVLTMKSAKTEFDKESENDAGKIAEAMSNGALMGARGNSGVILSQFLRGWASALYNSEIISPLQIVNALKKGMEFSYESVSNPVEGTMLTVIKYAYEGAYSAYNNVSNNIREIWDEAYKSAKEALENTPELLPILKQAQVVDAGGLGIVAIMDGMKSYFNGTNNTPPVKIQVKNSTIAENFIFDSNDEEFGNCIQFIINNPTISKTTLENKFSDLASSVVIVDATKLFRIHVHSEDPDPILKLANEIGTISDVNIQNMDDQKTEFFQDISSQNNIINDHVHNAIVAVVDGEGFIDIFKELGTTVIISGGQTKNPSTEEVLTAINDCNADNIFVFPNNKNIIGVSQQAAKLSESNVIVIPTTSVPAGISGLLGFDNTLSCEANEENILESVESVTTCEITKATKDITINDIDVIQDEYLCIINGEIRASEKSLTNIIDDTINYTKPTPENMITVYFGANINPNMENEIVSLFTKKYSQNEYDFVRGNQEIYDLIISIE
ncbi:MAG: DAK2 domain-containing protein [Dehalococcoidia bacterium]|tara:strand:+ start:32 stop:1678 length:1647 start_codon:yes stop_codon:yes gene_type:complete